MKIRFLLHNLFTPGGGVVTVTLGLAEALAEDHDVELVSLFATGRPPVHRFPEGVPVRALIRKKEEQWTAAERRAARQPSAYATHGEPRLRQYSALVDERVDAFLKEVEGGAIVTMQPALNVMLGALGTDRYLRIAQDHRPIINRHRELRQAYLDTAPSLDAFLALTRADARRFRRLFGGSVLVRRMTNGVPQYDGEQSTLDSKLVLAAGRLKPSKGFDILLEAWASVTRRHPDWRLHIYGEGLERSRLEELMSELGLDTAELKGFTTEMSARMAESSLFVLSSRTEGYGMVLVEAMSCGVPVVSTDAPFGPSEIIDHGVDGVLVANGDPEALADGICRMIELTPDERQAFGRAARAKSIERSVPAVAAEWTKLLDELEVRRARRARRGAREAGA